MTNAIRLVYSIDSCLVESFHKRGQENSKSQHGSAKNLKYTFLTMIAQNIVEKFTDMDTWHNPIKILVNKDKALSIGTEFHPPLVDWHYDLYML